MSIKASRILGIGLAFAAVGALAACSDDSTGDNNRRRLEGRLNGGGPRIQIEGTNGGIRLSAR